MNTQLLDEKTKKEIKEARERIDEYEGTIHAIWSFISLTTYDSNVKGQKSGAHYSLGREMKTSASNRVTQSETVTPDAVIQVGNQLGYVVEAKYSMPMDQTYWHDDAQQLLKYDDNLLGWWTVDKKMPSHNTVLLIEFSRSVLFKEYIEEWLQKNNASFYQNFSIVDFGKADNANSYYAFRKIYGEIEDEALSKTLRVGIKVPRDAILATYKPKKFYDAPPPIVEITMVTLWIHAFPTRREGVPFDKKNNGYPIRIDLDELTTDIQKLYGQPSEDDRSVAFPKRDWIKDALEEFEKMGLARKLDKKVDGYDYVVNYKDLRTNDVLEYFVIHRKKRRAKKEKQMAMF